MYHEIELPGRPMCQSDLGYVRYIVSEADFCAQLQWLQSAGWKGMSVPEALKYPDGMPVLDPVKNAPYPQPEYLDMKKNIAFGRSIKGDWLAKPELAEKVVTGQPMDYQRPYGLPGAWLKLPGWFKPEFTNVTAYNVGVVGAAAGIHLDVLLRKSGEYNQKHGNPANANTPYGRSPR